MPAARARWLPETCNLACPNRPDNDSTLAGPGRHRRRHRSAHPALHLRSKEIIMTVTLTKGGNVSLTKQAPGLSAVRVGLGWDVRTTTGDDFDLDASAILCDQAGKVISDLDFVF